MRLSATVPGKDLAEKLSNLQQLHLRDTDIWLNPDSPLMDASELRELLTNEGVSLSQLSCYTNLECAPGPILEKQMDRLHQVIQYAGEAGIRCVVSGCGHMDATCPDEVFSPHPDNWTPEAMNRLVSNCQIAATWAEDAGTLFCVESWVLLTLNSPEALAELVQRVDSPGFGILLDPVNMMNLDTHFVSGQMIQKSFDLLGDNIKIVHAKDSVLIGSSFTFHMSEAIPGRGKLDYVTLLKCMDTLKDEETPLHIEHLPTLDDVIEARDYILAMAAHAGVEFR